MALNDFSKDETVKLSIRLKCVADMVNPGARVADIGTDHAYIPIYLIQHKVASSVLAMDVRKGPLEGAKEHIRQCHLEDNITTKLSDGLIELCDGEADTVIIAGMGGRLVCRILEDGRPFEKGVENLILQSQSELQQFREFLRQKRYQITKEDMVIDEGRFYPVIGVCKADDNAADVRQMGNYSTAIKGVIDASGCDEETALRICDRFGPCLLLNRNEVLISFLQKGLKESSSILSLLDSNKHEDRREQILCEQRDIETALKYLER